MVKRSAEESAGIYQRTRQETESASELPAALNEFFGGFDLDESLKQIEGSALAVLAAVEASQFPFKLPTTPIDISLHHWEAIRDAREAMLDLTGLRHHLAKDETRSAALQALKLGRVYERMLIRTDERYVKQVKVTTKKLRAQQVADTAKRQKKVTEAYERISRNKRLKKTTIVARIAKETGIPLRRVWDYVPKK
jgi:hypothetical protein